MEELFTQGVQGNCYTSCLSPILELKNWEGVIMDAQQICFEKLTVLLDEMRIVLLASGVPEKRLVINVERKKLKTLVDAYDWLHDLYMSHEFNHAVEIRSLLPETVWKRYTIFNIKGLQEQKLWSNACELLLKRWRHKRPNIFGRLRCRKPK